MGLKIEWMKLGDGRRVLRGERELGDSLAYVVVEG